MRRWRVCRISASISTRLPKSFRRTALLRFRVVRSIDGRRSKKSANRCSARTWTDWSFASANTRGGCERRLHNWQEDAIREPAVEKRLYALVQGAAAGVDRSPGLAGTAGDDGKEVGELTAFADKAKADGIKHVVLLGMGGSSLAPEVFQQTFGNALGLSRIASSRQHPSGGGESGRSAVSIWPTRCFSSRASRGRRPRPILSSIISGTSSNKLKASPVHISSPSPIPARRWKN